MIIKKFYKAHYSYSEFDNNIPELYIWYLEYNDQKDDEQVCNFKGFLLCCYPFSEKIGELYSENIEKSYRSPQGILRNVQYKTSIAIPRHEFTEAFKMSVIYGGN